MSESRPLVYVEWVDAESGPATWEPVADAIKAQPAPARSVGWVIAQDADRLVIVPHIANDEVGGRIAIPAPWITRIVELEEPA